MTPEYSCRKIISVSNNQKRSKLLNALKDSLLMERDNNKFKLLNASEISDKYGLNISTLENYGLLLSRKKIFQFLTSIGYSPSRINISMSMKTSEYNSLFLKNPLKSNYGAYIYTFAEIIALMSKSYIKLDKIVNESFSSYNFTDKNGLYVPTNKIIIPDVYDELQRYFIKNPNLIFEIPPRKFEELIASIFKNSGYDVELTPQTRDGGYDLIAVNKNEFVGYNKFIIECKRNSKENKVGIGVLRNLYGVIQLENATKGIITTTSSFTKDAKDFAASYKYKIELKDFNNLRDWVKSLNF